MSWSRPEEAVVLAGAALVLAATGLLLLVRRPAPPIRIIEAPTGAEVVIQLDGAVARPGLYRLPPGARLSDALAAAGGTRPDADLGEMNQARRLRDGERVAVASAGDKARAGAAAADGLLDLNAATAAQLETLPGVGPVLARRIVEHRASRGGFQRLDDLLQVKGVGPHLLDGVRARVVIR